MVKAPRRAPDTKYMEKLQNDHFEEESSGNQFLHHRQYDIMYSDESHPRPQTQHHDFKLDQTRKVNYGGNKNSGQLNNEKTRLHHGSDTSYRDDERFNYLDLHSRHGYKKPNKRVKHPKPIRYYDSYDSGSEFQQRYSESSSPNDPYYEYDNIEDYYDDQSPAVFPYHSESPVNRQLGLR